MHEEFGPEGDHERNEKEKKKKASEALLAFHKRLQVMCKNFSTANEWYEFIREVFNPVLEDHKQVLTDAQLRRLREASRLLESTRQGIIQACKALDLEIENTLQALQPPTPPQKAPIKVPKIPLAVSASLAIGIALVAALVSFMASYSATEVTVMNNGCGPFSFSPVLNMIPGISVPDVSISSGEQAIVRLPSVSIGIDSTQADTIQISILGINRNIPNTGKLSSITFDDLPDLLNQHIQVTIQPRSQHHLAITCN
jgi:hypothetical protein